MTIIILSAQRYITEGNGRTQLGIYFVLFILLYFAISFYVGWNGWTWLKSTFGFKYKKTYFLGIFLLAMSFVFARIFSSKILEIFGGIWMVLIGYGLILLPIANIIYFLSKKRWKKQMGYLIVAFFAVVFIAGSYFAWTPTIREYNVTIDKQLDNGQREIKMLMASDFHLGVVVGKKHLEKFVDIVNQEKPDIVLIPGDIINDNIKPYTDNQLNDIMAQISAPLGVFASPGNHDYYGGDTNELKEELESVGVRLLMDEIAEVNGMTIVGRHDPTEKIRQSIEELMKEVDRDKTVIILDHQPTELNEAMENGADFIFSGHTHRGQLFPASLITSRMYENDWGYLQKSNLHSFTSSGFGFWGPAFRIGSQSEVMIINVTFQ